MTPPVLRFNTFCPLRSGSHEHAFLTDFSFAGAPIHGVVKFVEKSSPHTQPTSGSVLRYSASFGLECVDGGFKIVGGAVLDEGSVSLADVLGVAASDVNRMTIYPIASTVKPLPFLAYIPIVWKRWPEGMTEHRTRVGRQFVVEMVHRMAALRQMGVVVHRLHLENIVVGFTRDGRSGELRPHAHVVDLAPPENLGLFTPPSLVFGVTSAAGNVLVSSTAVAKLVAGDDAPVFAAEMKRLDAHPLQNASSTLEDDLYVTPFVFAQFLIKNTDGGASRHAFMEADGAERLEQVLSMVLTYAWARIDASTKKEWRRAYGDIIVPDAGVVPLAKYIAALVKWWGLVPMDRYFAANPRSPVAAISGAVLRYMSKHERAEAEHFKVGGSAPHSPLGFALRC